MTKILKEMMSNGLAKIAGITIGDIVVGLLALPMAMIFYFTSAIAYMCGVAAEKLSGYSDNGLVNDIAEDYCEDIWSEQSEDL